MAVKEELKKLGLHFIVVELGEVEIMEKISPEERELLKTALVMNDSLNTSKKTSCFFTHPDNT